jgi:hypothetical protein
MNACNYSKNMAYGGLKASFVRRTASAPDRELFVSFEYLAWPQDAWLTAFKQRKTSNSEINTGKTEKIKTGTAGLEGTTTGEADGNHPTVTAAGLRAKRQPATKGAGQGGRVRKARPTNSAPSQQAVTAAASYIENAPSTAASATPDYDIFGEHLDASHMFR